ncbi:EamA family transporter [Clostridium hydrogeniformans]|uniref:EamA family transporter n=1 Tax=Clostridium hydrogeniformans TaxID=349933 RepID=UPI0004810A28|nr:EamA family transporter [Clostridium hydrogeniformans]
MSMIPLYLVIMTLFGAFGGYFLKLSSEKIVDLKSLFFNKFIYIGGLFYILGAGVNIYILKYLPYTLVLPLNSLTYVWTLIIAKVFLKEKVNKNKIIGIGLIFIGTIIIGI